jgi:sterol desaturase/sphingolipid hydroxylase (fatty acid hydroxylase superfamily)
MAPTPPPPLSLSRTVVLYSAYFVLGVFLLYSSGLPFLICSICQQTQSLPGSDSGATFYRIMFPLGVPSEINDATSINLIGIDYLSIAIPAFVLSIVVENVIIFLVLPPAHRPPNTPRLVDSMTSVALGVLQVLVAQVLFLQWFEPLYNLVYDNLRITDAFSDATNPRNWWLCLFFADFLYYWFHRLSHEVSWMWTTHVVHHSSEEYNLTTALRQPALDFLAPSFLVSNMLGSLLFPYNLFAAHTTFNLLYQFWIHTELIPPLPRVEMVFNTPSLHRIHHARNVRALGKNYAAIFILWDRMFGTYEPEIVPSEEEEEQETIYYGVVPQLKSWNPFYANVHHFYHMLFIQSKWHGILSPFKHWTPTGTTGCPRIGSKMNPEKKFHTDPPSFAWKMYGGVTFVVVLMLVYLYLGSAASDSIRQYVSPTMSKFWFDSALAVAITGMTLWSLTTVSCIMSLGVAGTTSTRSSIVVSEIMRHGFIVIVCVGLGMSKVDSDGGRRLLYFSGIYAVFALIMLAVIRNEPDKQPSVEGADVIVALLPNERRREEVSVADWTWYRSSRYD